MNLFEELAQVAKEKGIKMKWLAEQMGISQGYLSELINGRKEGKVAQWEKMADALSLSVVVEYHDYSGNDVKVIKGGR